MCRRVYSGDAFAMIREKSVRCCSSNCCACVLVVVMESRPRSTEKLCLSVNPITIEASLGASPRLGPLCSLEPALLVWSDISPYDTECTVVAVVTVCSNIRS